MASTKEELLAALQAAGGGFCSGQALAEQLGVSYSSFRKLFKEYTGISPALYQQDLKLQRAKELLSTTDLFVKEIAYMLNFDSPDYFSSKFKRKTGLKPSDFRNIDRK